MVDTVTDFSSLVASSASLKAWPCAGARYKVERLLGCGAFASCFVATKTSPRWEKPIEVALKVIPRYDKEVAREVEMMLLLRNTPHVAPHLHEFFYVLGPDERTCHLCLAMELYDGTLRELVPAWATTRAASAPTPPLLRLARRIGQQLAPALAHLHGLGVVHRDIKLDNVLVRQQTGAPPSFCLTDYGQAKRVSAADDDAALERSLPYAFAQHFRAPELFFGCSAYSSAPDVWALGCTLAEVLLGGEPLFCQLGGGGADSDGDEKTPPGAKAAARLESSTQRQLLALFDALGTPPWSAIVAMHPALAHDTERRRVWMGMPPRGPTRCWRARLAGVLADDAEDAEERALATAAMKMLQRIFVWDPAARPHAAALRDTAYLKGPLDELTDDLRYQHVATGRLAHGDGGGD